MNLFFFTSISKAFCQSQNRALTCERQDVEFLQQIALLQFLIKLPTGEAGYKTLHKIAVRSYKQPFGCKI